MRTTTLPTKHGTWAVPFGFGAAHWRAYDDGNDAFLTRMALLMVGIDVSETFVESWHPFCRAAAEVWAVRVHLRAGDCPIRVPPKPNFLPQAWQGEGDVGGIWGPGPTPFTHPVPTPDDIWSPVAEEAR